MYEILRYARASIKTKFRMSGSEKFLLNTQPEVM